MRLITTLLALMVALPTAAFSESTTSPQSQTAHREHPLLFADATVFAKAKARTQTHPWAAAEMQKLIAAGDQALSTPLNIPKEGGQWNHYYSCKKCGTELQFKDGKHICKGCGAEYAGWPYDQVVLTHTHVDNWRDLKDLGIAYALTGDEKYANKARELLLAYAAKYKTYPIHDVKGKESTKGARVFAQTLDESVHLIGVAWAYDLIYNSPCLAAADKHQIENDFLRPATETIMRNDMRTSNWQTWHNAAVAAVGFCLQDEKLIAHALDGKSGVRFQLSHSVLKDGFWNEGAPTYHFYSMNALQWTVLAAAAAGIDFYSDPVYKSLFDAPLYYAFPDLRLPAVNDSTVISLTSENELYEPAYARYHDPAYLEVLSQKPRASVEAFLFGVDELPADTTHTIQSKDFPGVGSAVLRQHSADNDIYVHFKYGPHGGGHGHYDKLSIILYACGRQLAPDPGALAYSVPLHAEWYRQTIAHNTVVVDGKMQLPTTGKLTMFETKPGFSVAQAECDTASTGVLLRRTVGVTPNYVIDVFSVESDTTHTYDWAYHNFGSLTSDLKMKPQAKPLFPSAGYQHIKEMHEAATDSTWTADFKQKNANVRVTMVGSPATTIFSGIGSANKPPEPCPMLIARREGNRTDFISIIEPYQLKPSVTGLQQLPDPNALKLQVSRGNQTDVLEFPKTSGQPASLNLIPVK